MAAAQEQKQEHNFEKLLSSYLGLSFTIFLGILPENSINLVSKLQTQNKDLTFKLKKAEDQLKQLHSRRKEDSKANARVVEIFASHRHSWQQEEKRLLQQIDEGNEEIAHLRGKLEDFERMESEFRDRLEELKREISERDEMLNYFGINGKACELENGYSVNGDGVRIRDSYSEMGLRYGKAGVSDGLEFGQENCFLGSGIHSMEEFGELYGQSNGISPEFSNPTSELWAQRDSIQQDVQYEPAEQLYNAKHFMASSRRESPWKVDGESTGVSTKLKLLEQELHNMERVGKMDASNIPSLLKKQAKRYQTLGTKIDDLCRRMQANDPCEPTLSSEFRSQRQTEFLLEAFRLQQGASETSQKLAALQSETVRSSFGNDLEGHTKLAIRRSLDSIRNNFTEIQRNLEIWLARIIGDLEGNLSKDAASRGREYYVSRYPFVQ